MVQYQHLGQNGSWRDLKYLWRIALQQHRDPGAAHDHFGKVLIHKAQVFGQDTTSSGFFG